MKTAPQTDKRESRLAGFSLLEIMISFSLLTIVLGIVMQLVWRVEKGYALEKQVAEMQQNERYTLDFISRAIRSAGNNPEGIVLDAIIIDPDGNGQNDDIRIQSDLNADGDILDSGEDVLFRVVNSGLRYRDGPPGATEAVLVGNITGLGFATFDASGNSTTTPSLISRVDISISAQTDLADLQTKQVRTKTLTTSAHLRK
jgi:Tfp pilus assembly protein PilW